LEDKIKTSNEQNETLEKNKVDLNETITLLNKNINDQLKAHSIEVSNKNEELKNLEFEFAEFKKEIEINNNSNTNEIEKLKTTNSEQKNW